MSDYLTDEEQAERLKRWWDENGLALIATLAVAVLAVVGWRYYQSWSSDRAAAASDAYRDYLEARSAGEPVTELLGAIDGEFDGTTYQAFSLLYRAADEVAGEDFEAALEHLQTAIEVADLPVLADLARLNAAKVQFELDRLDDCLATLGGIRSRGFEMSVAELSGDVHVALGQLEAAREAYRAGIEATRDLGAATTAPGLAILELKLATVPVAGDRLPAQVERAPGDAGEQAGDPVTAETSGTADVGAGEGPAGGSP